MNQWDNVANPTDDPVFAKEVRALIAGLDGGYSNRQDGKHVYLTNEKWSDPKESSITVGNSDYTYSEVFGAWYFDRTMIPDQPSGQKPAYKVVYVDQTNVGKADASLGGMCGGKFKTK